MVETTPINFFFEASISLASRTRLKAFISNLFQKERRKLESLNYIFCTDERLLEINRSFLAHDYYTDIITFDLAAANQPTVGEIYISLDRVRDNAVHHSTTLKEELHRVIFHGALHLCGYRDKSKAETATMRAMEDKYLRMYFAGKEN